ncbi:fused MFS/spermidine synthase [Ilumatobacter nonamiensis]|uniref:fused MFS/spermidine synthase n=1 Tax=Ilumatobacter nonamiensis TaxID=467093 RepID=UPI00034BF21B|nr:fused MFS/spermidine synthase [Ilumatobacter nonamiensis]
MVDEVTPGTDPSPEHASREGSDPSRDGGGPLAGWLAIALVTGTSAAVLVLEILAGRLLAPYVGVSLETFTGIIGTILAGIAVGAWAGGVAADHIDPRRLLPMLLVVGGALAIATIPIVRILGEGSGSGGGARILVLTACGFLPSATVLSAVPPAVIKLQLRDLASTGTTVGRLSAWSTAGALFGTFFTGFVLVSTAGVTTLIVAVGLLLMVAGVAMWLVGRLASTTEMLSVGGLAAVALVGVVAVDSPCETQTAYYCLTVVEDPDVASGRTLVLDDLRHSYVDLDDPTRLEFWYIRRIVDAIEVQTADSDAPIDAVYLGGGAFTVPRYVRATRPGSDQTILEIDGDLVEVVEDEIDFDPGDDVEIIVGDGRLSMADIGTDSADVVVGDAFGSRAVPFHLATEEFLADAARVVRPDGIYVANIIDGASEDFLRAETATIARVFDHVALIRGPGIVNGVNGNSAVVASASPLDIEALEARLDADVDPGGSDDPDRVVGELLAGAELAEYLDGATILTDDYAPVDQLIAGTV